MKNILMTFSFILIATIVQAQPVGYYNGTEGKTGDELKSALHEIINDHVVYSYFASKTIMKFSDADPAINGNVILIYTGRSQNGNDYGNGGNQINREHVWAKSHGNFADLPPMYSDVHNLKPADASVNQDKSNKDFDNGGLQHPEATGCYYTSDTWEPRDAVKGDVARIIFYMDARYEGTNGEIDLTVVDEINTYPLPHHGKLSTLLQWNLQDPPDEFERNRNNVIFSWQKNRNPFIDHPEYAQLIWGGANLPVAAFDDFSITPANPSDGEPVQLMASVTANQGNLNSVKVHWGTSYTNLTNMLAMQSTGGNNYEIELPAQPGATTIYFQIEAETSGGTATSIVYNYYVAPVFNGTLTSIYDIQGQTNVSPFNGQTVSTTGVVTANFGENYFLQNGNGAWNGLFIYDPNRNPSIGDSIIVTGKIEEYYQKTEMKDVNGYYLIASGKSLPAPAPINTGDAAEAYESVLVRVNNAICTDDQYQSNFFMWKVNDGSGEMLVHNTSIFEFEPVEGESYTVTGPLNYDFDEWKIEIRLEGDVQSGIDVFPPEVNAVEAINDTLIRITYSEDLNTATATTIDNYLLDNDITIHEVYMHSFLLNVVFLKVSNMPTNTYQLSISEVEDFAGNAMPLTIKEFYHESSSILEQVGITNVVLFPNPAMGIFHLTMSAADASLVEISVQDLLGRSRFTRQELLSAGVNNFHFENLELPAGIYLIKITKDNVSGFQKLIVKKQ
ncbi:MAG: T9SS type A sorting domain-containing protein [Bacteroidales bacterium]|nr:T9SS type A sorting domain-containing protein [Bacteroidales bacterium]